MQEAHPKKKIYKVNSDFAKKAHINLKKYKKLYQQSIQDPDTFWGKQANQFISWFQPWKKVLKGSFKKHDLQWFVNGKLNVCYNCVDRHLETRIHQTAIIWEGDDPKNSKKITYGELYEQVCRLSNVLKKIWCQKRR